MADGRALFFAFLLLARPCVAQSPAAPSTTPAPEPPLRRWFEIQSFTASTRYRFISSNAGVVSANDLQYKETFRARLSADRARRYTLNIGVFSGSSFIGSWDNTGLGLNRGDYRSHYIKQLFAAVTPVRGVEMQVGGLYVTRGEMTEFASYDDDGYVVGERVSVRRPDRLYLDEVSVSHGMIGPSNTPNLLKRWNGFSHANYDQVLVSKRVIPSVTASFDYSTQSGAETIRAAVSVRFAPAAPLSGLRYEQYRRLNARAAGGFVLTAERPITRWVRLQGGYASIDEHYGNLNADRIQRGRRAFAIAAVPIVGPLSATVFVTRALGAAYAISNRTRFDAVLQYDVLSSLRKTGRI